MVESLTSKQLVTLVNHVNNMMQPEFEILAFALDMPPGLMSSRSEAQGIRAIELLKWVKGTTGCGMDEFLDVLNQVAPLPSDISSLVVISTVEVAESTTTEVMSDLVTTQPRRAPTPVVLLSEQDERIKFPLPNGITLELVYIPPGIFLMGSPSSERERLDTEGPQHNVKIWRIA